MADKTATRAKRPTTTVPITTMEEIPVLSDGERAQLRASLEQAEARMKSGQGIEFDPEKFEKHLIDIYRGKKR
jgi:hypothetical protein